MGISRYVYAYIRSTIRSSAHLGNSFEAHVRGAVNLMHLALSSPRAEPAKFFFASSISAVANWPGSGLVPETVTDNPAVAQEIG